MELVDAGIHTIHAICVCHTQLWEFLALAVTLLVLLMSDTSFLLILKEIMATFE